MPAATDKKHATKWRTCFMWICIVLGVVSVAGAVITRYIQQTFLDTDTYVATVAPLPQKPEVAKALTTFATSRLFNAQNVQTRIENFLPAQLDALAAPLTTILKQNVSRTTENFVRGDTFQTIWVTANRLTQQGILRIANRPDRPDQLPATASLNIEPLLQVVRTRLGNNATPSEQQLAQAANIRADLRQNVEQLRRNIHAVNAGALVLPYLSIAFILLAFAVAGNRQRATIGIGIALVTASVCVAILCKILSNQVLDDITNQTYRAAATVTYEALYHNLRMQIIGLGIAGLFLIILAVLASNYTWAKRLRNAMSLSKIRRTKLWKVAMSTRRFFRRYEPWLYLLGVSLTALWLLIASALTLSTLSIALSLMTAYLAVIHIVARAAPAHD